MYTVVCRRIFEAEGGVERELAKRENEMGSPVDKTVWARDEMSFREDIKILCFPRFQKYRILTITQEYVRQTHPAAHKGHFPLGALEE